MIEDVLSEKIREYAPATAIEQEHVLQELMQQFVLSSLGRAGFFNEAAFHGGTFLRMVHNANRFSEDLDIHPPDGSFFETHYLAFPVMTALTTQDLPSAFAGKAHALLCRSYTKGRDWYDFLWYIRRNVLPNFALLTSAIAQTGPWEGQWMDAPSEWFIERLRATIRAIDWTIAKNDVQRFLPMREQESLKLWSTDFFLYHADQLEKQIIQDTNRRKSR